MCSPARVGDCPLPLTLQQTADDEQQETAGRSLSMPVSEYGAVVMRSKGRIKWRG